VDLLARIYEPCSGVILLDGRPLEDFELTWLRSQVVVISHEPVLFHASLLENLRYASPDASIETVVAAAKIVGFHDFIDALPQGYNTVVGERGARLSTGQRQRLALARAVLKRPAILVLDEALSGLDVASESQLRAALEAFMTESSIVVVTHRLSSLRKDDPVIVLEHGQVVWSGVYGALPSSASDVYASLKEWERQSA
jgi:ABC-type multidrug transport system fused ATPase/permease subunit